MSPVVYPSQFNPDPRPPERPRRRGRRRLTPRQRAQFRALAEMVGWFTLLILLCELLPRLAGR